MQLAAGSEQKNVSEYDQSASQTAAFVKCERARGVEVAQATCAR